MKTVCRALGIVKKTTTIIQSVFVYYAFFPDKRILNKIVYVADDVSLLDDSCLSFIMSKIYSIFITKIYTKIKKKTNTYNRPYWFSCVIKEKVISEDSIWKKNK